MVFFSILAICGCFLVEKPIIYIVDEDSEADTCRKEVLPKLYESQNLERIKQLRVAEAKDIKNLLSIQKLLKVQIWLPMNEVAPIHRRPVKIELDEKYQELGTRSFFIRSVRERKY